jgi:hypothetical protein
MEDAAAWALTAVGLLVVLLGLVVGIDVHEAVLDRGRAAEQDLNRVSAVLVADAPTVQDAGGTAMTSERTARYTDPLGRQHEAVVTVNGDPPTGAVVPVWVDRDGNVTARPPTDADAVVFGTAVAFGVVAAGLVLLLGTWAVVRRELDRRNAVSWAQEWALVEPEWSGRSR